MKSASGWVLGVVLAAACSVGCGETSLVIGGDPEQQTLVAAGAAAGVGAGGAGAGAVGPGVGGAGIGGSLSLSVGGEAAGTGPYPPVHWENGRADASYCPAGALGIACVHVDRDTTACDPAGEPSCNGCSCVLTCESSADCESGSNGAPGACVPLGDGSSSCFLSCESGGCPLGMVCIPHPNDGSAVCVWVPPDPSNMPVR